MALPIFVAGFPAERDFHPVRTIAAIATAYCSGNPTTKTGYPLSIGVLAADPSVLPMHTRVRILNRDFVVEDIGSAIKGDRVDIYMPDCWRAKQWGRQSVDVQVIEGTSQIVAMATRAPAGAIVPDAPPGSPGAPQATAVQIAALPLPKPAPAGTASRPQGSQTPTTDVRPTHRNTFWRRLGNLILIGAAVIELKNIHIHFGPHH